MKKYLKKVTTMILAFSMVFGLLFGSNVFASNEDQSEPYSSDGLYMLCSEVPDNVNDYVTQTFLEYLCTQLMVEEANGNTVINQDINAYKLGTPFQLLDNSERAVDCFYFPILEDSNIVFVLQIYPAENCVEGTVEATYNCGGMITKTLVDELNTLKEVTISSEVEPISLMRENTGNLYYEIGSKNQLFKEFPEVEGVTSNINVTKKSNAITKEQMRANNILKENSDISHPMTRSARLTPAWFKYNPTNITEIQTDLPWCGAYVTATIIRNQTNYSQLNAYDVMHGTYPNESYETLITHGIEPNKIPNCAKTLGINNAYFLNRPLSLTEAEQQLNAGSRFYMSWGMYQDGTRVGGHSYAAIGGCRYYNDDAHGYYTIWNPWSWDISTIAFAAMDGYTINGIPSKYERVVCNLR